MRASTSSAASSSSSHSSARGVRSGEIACACVATDIASVPPAAIGPLRAAA
jgi:hypothetical protein